MPVWCRVLQAQRFQLGAREQLPCRVIHWAGALQLPRWVVKQDVPVLKHYSTSGLLILLQRLTLIDATLHILVCLLWLHQWKRWDLDSPFGNATGGVLAGRWMLGLMCRVSPAA